MKRQERKPSSGINAEYFFFFFFFFFFAAISFISFTERIVHPAILPFFSLLPPPSLTTLLASSAKFSNCSSDLSRFSLISSLLLPSTSIDLHKVTISSCSTLKVPREATTTFGRAGTNVSSLVSSSS
eukprot:TRINITY_DN5522_c0_g2_i2.p1 TRINITY_DN5522_c0_g2~~TRINITY_DN5522_c0_g2_i2.p1  ORF type:complete len:127 (-),score=18.14 TRINITY_DN5522_c0_g2_i2:377-757(-)